MSDALNFLKRVEKGESTEGGCRPFNMLKHKIEDNNLYVYS